MAHRTVKRDENYQCIEYWIKKNPDKTLEECEELRKEAVAKKQKNNKYKIDYWVTHNPDKTLEECEELRRTWINERSYQHIEYWRKKFPGHTDAEYEQMMREQTNKAVGKRPDNRGENNPGHRSKTTEKQRRENSPMCIEHWIKQNPDKTLEECEELWKQHMNKIHQMNQDKTKQVLCKEFWLSRGYSEEETKKMLKQEAMKRTFTLKKCISRYGEEEGRKKFQSRQEKWMKSLHNSFQHGNRGMTQSNISNTFISELIKEFPDSEQEFVIGKYSYDFRYKNTLIEFNGDYWHCNPNIYDAEFINTTMGVKASEIWSRDKIKTSYAQNQGYKVLVVWEQDFKNDPIETTNNCIRFIYEHTNK